MLLQAVLRHVSVLLSSDLILHLEIMFEKYPSLTTHPNDDRACIDTNCHMKKRKHYIKINEAPKLLNIKLY
jgi:hypothetical protein